MSIINVNDEPSRPVTFEEPGYVQIIRCRDCKYRSEKTYMQYGTREVMVCKINDVAKKLDWYCADGVRKADAGEREEDD